MIHLIRDVRQRGNLHLILCSHLLRDVEECCEEVLILKEGRIVQYSNLEEERRANRRFLELELEGDREAFATAIRELGCECALSSRHRLKAVLAEKVEVRDLYRAAAARGVRIRRLSHKRDSLEDIFIKAMNNGSGASEGGAMGNGNGGL